MIPLWTAPLLLAAVLTILGGIGSWKRRRQLRRRPRPAWDVPRGLTALDISDAYAHTVRYLADRTVR